MHWLPLLLTLLAAGSAVTADSGQTTSGLECAELQPSIICNEDVPSAFEYSDGCSRFRCGFLSYTTLQSRECPTAQSAADLRRCREIARDVFSRLTPRVCPNAEAEQVCSSVRGVGGGFRFTDGCNRFACAADGSVAGSTRRSCSRGDSSSAYCNFIVSLQIEAFPDTAEDSANSTGVECPDLGPSVVCNENVPSAFVYTDGCSRYRCGFMSYTTLHSGDCPKAKSVDDLRLCRSVARDVYSRLKPRACPNAEATQVCASVRGVGSEGDGFRFTDGCNRFACAADGSVAGSTWRSCQSGDSSSAFCAFVVNYQVEAASPQSSAGGASFTVDGTSRECPDLQPSVVCNDRVPSAFEYSDGCSRYRCGFMSYTTLHSGDCPKAESLDDLRRCRAVARDVYSRLTPRACPNAEATQVCTSVRRAGSEGGGFRFTDGCNRFACAADGSVAGITWRTCSSGDSSSAFCSFIVNDQVDGIEEIFNQNQTVESSFSSKDASLECPDLQPSVVCNENVPSAFVYSDGCSRYRCGFMSYTTMNSGDCPRAESREDRRRCRDVARDVYSRLTPRACPNAEAENVCASARGAGGNGFRFTDGCNRFACAADGSVAGSTWRSCRSGDSSSAFCSFIEEDQQVDGMEDGPLLRRRRRLTKRQHF